MRHRFAHRRLNRTSAHRRALRRSLVSNLIEHESIVTTLPKAQEVKAFAEKLITLAKRDTLTARRRAIALLNERRIADGDAQQPTIISKLFKVLGPRFADRPGGYTRIVRLARRRLGDGSAKAVLQFVDQAIASTGVRARRTTKATHTSPTSARPSAAPPAATPAHADAQSADRNQSETPTAPNPESDSSTKQKQADQTQE